MAIETANANAVDGAHATSPLSTDRQYGDNNKQNGKKKRRLKIAPRFYFPDKYSMDARAIRMNEDNVALLRDVFTTATCRCFVLKSFSDANFHKSLKYGIWSSTYAHNVMLDQVFRSEFSALRPVLFFFSVCGSKHFNGIARMTSGLRTDIKFDLWEKPKFEGFFNVEWLQVKDVPNFVLTDIKMSNTPTKKSITSCRDCEEVLFEEANRFIEIFTAHSSRSSAWDDYEVYDAKQPALEAKRGISTPLDPAMFIPPVSHVT